MNIFIAKDHTGEPTAVVLADHVDKANIAFAALEAPAHSVEEIDPNTTTGIGGLVFLLTSHKVNSNDFSHRIGGFSFRKWKRGK